MAMMVYASLHILGRQGYELLIDQSIAKAKSFADMIELHPDFELVTQPTLCLLTYRLVPQSVQDDITSPSQLAQVANTALDDLTVSVQKQQREAGKSFVSRTRLQVEKYHGQTITVFRVVLANPLTTKEDLQAILNEQLAIAKTSETWRKLCAQYP
jgi:glutamate decarboxylase